MKYKELRDIARRDGLVRWPKSGLIERLSVSRDGEKPGVYAESYATVRHKLNAPFWASFDCVEMEPKALVSFGSLIDAADRVSGLGRTHLRPDRLRF